MKYLEYSDGTRVPVNTTGFVELIDGIEVIIPENAKPGDRWDIIIEPFKEEKHLTSVCLGDSTYVSNNQRLLSEIKGNLVQTHRSTLETEGWSDLASKTTEDLRTNLIAVHYNHIFTARGRTLYWTDLDDVWNWYPRPQNEADFRVLEWECDDITAIAVVNDVLFIHFPTSVYTCEYTGKPAIVRISQRNEGHGSITHRALTVHKNSQFYMGVDNFYQWSPVEGIIPIGEEIWKRIINPDISEIFSYVDRVNKEIHWVIGDFIWAFNYVERHWSRYTAASALDQTTIPITNSESLQTSLESGSRTERHQSKGLYNIWCSDTGLMRKFQDGESINTTVSRAQPYLVSDEQTYGDIFGEKDTDKVVVDGAYGIGYDGFIIEVSAKKYVSDPDVFRKFDHWRHERLFKQADSVKHSGRSLKFKFTVADNIARWDESYIAEGQLIFEGLTLPVWNGKIKMDGCDQMQYLHIGLWDGGTNYINGQMRLDLNQFRLYAWGERVMLPQAEVGEDK